MHVDAVYRFHPMFAPSDAPLWLTTDDTPATVEGGDVYVLAPGVLMVGVSERTMFRAVTEALGTDHVRVLDTRQDVRSAEREQWNDGNNVLAVEPGVVIADRVDAEARVLLTDVAAVQRDFGTPVARSIRRATVPELVELDLPEGSMAPKVKACRRFLDGGDRRNAAIGALEQAVDVLAGSAGTRVAADIARATRHTGRQHV